MNKPLESLTELEAFNPIKIKDYCYRDGCPTDFIRSPITIKQIQQGRLPYFCQSCDDRAYYTLKLPKKTRVTDER